MDGGAWWAAVHGVAKSWTRLSDFTFTFHFHALEKELATHSSVPAWRIPGMREPCGLPSMGSHRVRNDWSDLAAASDFYKRPIGWHFCFKALYWRDALFWSLEILLASSMLAKNLLEMHEAWVRFLGQKDPLENRMAIHSSILLWDIPWTEEPGGPQSIVLQSWWEMKQLSMQYALAILGFLGGAVVKNLPANAEDAKDVG